MQNAPIAKFSALPVNVIERILAHPETRVDFEQMTRGTTLLHSCTITIFGGVVFSSSFRSAMYAVSDDPEYGRKLVYNEAKDKLCEWLGIYVKLHNSGFNFESFMTSEDYEDASIELDTTLSVVKYDGSKQVGSEQVGSIGSVTGYDSFDRFNHDFPDALNEIGLMVIDKDSEEDNTAIPSYHLESITSALNKGLTHVRIDALVGTKEELEKYEQNGLKTGKAGRSLVTSNLMPLAARVAGK